MCLEMRNMYSMKGEGRTSQCCLPALAVIMVFVKAVRLHIHVVPSSIALIQEFRRRHRLR